MSSTTALLTGYSFLILALLSYKDVMTRHLPNYLTFGAYPICIILIIIDGFATRNDALFENLFRAFLGGATLLSFLILSKLINSNNIGMGDLKISPLFGAILAWQSWSAFGVGVLACFVANGLWALFLLTTGRAGKKTHLPLIPFMLIGFTVAIFA